MMRGALCLGGCGREVLSLSGRRLFCGVCKAVRREQSRKQGAPAKALYARRCLSCPTVIASRPTGARRCAACLEALRAATQSARGPRKPGDIAAKLRAAERAVQARGARLRAEGIFGVDAYAGLGSQLGGL